MRIESDPEAKEIILGKLRKYVLSDRPVIEPDGSVHQSDLTSCITKSFWKHQLGPQALDEMSALYFITGIGLEKALTNRESEDTTHRVHEGVRVSLDFMDKDTGLPIELKTTRMGFDARGKPTKGWPKGWERQVMGYAHVYERTEFSLVTLTVGRVGLYGNKFIFEDDELERYWYDFIQPRLRALLAAIDSSSPPEPYAYNDTWECDKCPMAVLCEGSKIPEGHMPRMGETDIPYLERKERD